VAVGEKSDDETYADDDSDEDWTEGSEKVFNFDFFV